MELKMECIPIISALRRMRQKVHKFETSLGYTMRPCLKKNGGRLGLSGGGR
jgi:hypothetical protein